MATQLRRVADRAERDDLVTVRVIPFKAGAHPGLIESFNLLEFDGALPDILFLDADRGALAMLTGDDPRDALAVALAKEDFETLIEAALPAADSITLMRSVAGEMSRI